MKFKSVLFLLLLVGVALTYTACKKLNDGSPAKSTVSTKTVSSQVALNVVAVLDGAFGGFNLSDGLDAPTNFGATRPGRLKLNDFGGSSLCGVVIDTAFTDNETTSDGPSSVTAQIKLSYICSNGVVSGFHIQDSLKVAASSSQYTANFGIGENLSLVSSNPQDDQAKFSINGTLNINLLLKSPSDKTQNADETFDYKFNSVVVDPATDDIVSGSANFYTKGSIASGDWNYIGTITFLGSHKAKIVINGTTYTADLSTGVVS